jgi:hypothetical protein
MAGDTGFEFLAFSEQRDTPPTPCGGHLPFQGRIWQMYIAAILFTLIAIALRALTFQWRDLFSLFVP